MTDPYDNPEPFVTPPASPPPEAATRNDVVPQTHLELLESIRRMTLALTRMPVPADSRVADVLGETRSIEMLLAEWRRSLLVETPQVEGEIYEVVEQRRAVRTFNVAAILTTAAAERPMPETLRELIDEDVLRIQPQWTKLNRYFADHGLELRIAKGKATVDDGDIDGPHVGEVWHTETKLIPKKEGR